MILAMGLTQCCRQMWTFKVSSYLVLNCPFANIIEVLALVLGVEIREGRGAVLVEPDLAENPGVGITHQCLADRVQAVRCN